MHKVSRCSGEPPDQHAKAKDVAISAAPTVNFQVSSADRAWRFVETECPSLASCCRLGERLLQNSREDTKGETA